MLINEASKMTNLTKKAIEYYIEQGLIVPDLLDNGYRDFSSEDIECLKRIAVLRRLGLSIGEIQVILTDDKNDELKKLSIKKELITQKMLAENTLLSKLSCCENYDDIREELNSIDQNSTIAERLLDAFPGYYGRFICLNFAQFLNQPLTTEDQKLAYKEILEFLDNIPTMHFPEDLQAYMEESTKNISTVDIQQFIDKNKQSIENPEQFLSENKETLDYYLKYMQSDEYMNSPAFKLQSLFKEFNKTSGYYDIFIPAMMKLSPSYAAYQEQCKIANDLLYAKYPDAKKFDS